MLVPPAFQEIQANKEFLESRASLASQEKMARKEILDLQETLECEAM